MSDVTFDMSNNEMHVHRRAAEPWKVTLLDTGEQTLTGGRLKRAAPHLDETFFLTYGDGVSDVDIQALLSHHRAAQTEATLTAIQPSGRYGAVNIEGDKIQSFLEKPKGDGKWVNGGFFVCEPSVIDRIGGDDISFEQAPLMGLAEEGQLSAYRHDGFWAAMDTLRDKNVLEDLWARGAAPWRIW